MNFLKKKNITNYLKSYDDEIKSINFYCKYFNKSTVNNILNFNKEIAINKTIPINIYLENNLEHFLYGVSDFSALESAYRKNNLCLRELNKIEYNSCLINESDFIFENQDSINILNKNNSINQIQKYQNITNYNLTEKLNHNDIAKRYVNYICKNLNSFENFIHTRTQEINITTSLIPQFSNLEDATYNVVDNLKHSGDYGVTFEELGLYLTKHGKKKTAYKKYGENHSKFAELIDFVLITRSSPRKIYLTSLGREFYSLKKEDKIKILIFQMLRMDIVKDIINNSKYDNFDLVTYLENWLANSTAKRRSPNIKSIFNFLNNNITLPKKLINSLKL